MTGPVVAQALVDRGTLAALSFVGLAVAMALGLVIAFVAVRGSRRSGAPGLQWLAVGVVLLSTGPIALRLVLSNVVLVADTTRAMLTAASELAGLAAILYAIYGVADEGGASETITVEHAVERERHGEAEGSEDREGKLLVPLVAVGGREAVIFLTELVTATVGFFVAFQAYRGYRRNDSAVMRSFAAGVLTLTSVPFVVSYALDALGTGDAGILFAITVLQVLGLGAVLHALTRA